MKNKNIQQPDQGPNAVGHKNVFTAVTTALVDLFSNKGQLPPLDKNIRLDGKTCLVTGANSGLGKAVAIDLAKKGGHVIMACRGGYPEAAEEVKRESGSDKVEIIYVDLADLNSVIQLCNQLKQRNISLDIAVMNAGLMPLNARKSAQGYELMFAVHFLANRLLLSRWIEDGVLPLQRPENNIPRVIFVSSEVHQSSDPINFSEFGKFTNYGLKDGMKYYALSKLHLTTFACELSRQVNGNGNPKVAIHALCPGPIASNIARESPFYIKPILAPIMKLLFRSPAQAAEPVLYLACDPGMGKRSGAYLHMMREKHMSAAATHPEHGSKLWQHSATLLADYLMPSEAPAKRASECH
jgi:NAD(P)-dependent dehydrogenase (short-subunit alcohol dehydrogenase family)